MKKAFTLIELIMILVVIGILSSAIIPRMNSNSLDKAAMEFLSSIRYTQHLAMISDKYDPSNENWYKERWQFIYGYGTESGRGTGGYYALSIFSDLAGTHSGKPDLVEMAISPLNKSQLMSGGYSGILDWEDSRATKRLNIGYTYGITNITYSGCGGQRISFDNKGRPFKGNDKNWTSSVDGILTTQCIFTLHKNSESINIYIEPETGYTHL